MCGKVVSVLVFDWDEMVEDENALEVMGSLFIGHPLVCLRAKLALLRMIDVG